MYGKMFAVKTASGSQDPITVDVEVNGNKIAMDTGAAVTIISKSMLKEILPKVQLKPTTIRLKTHTGEKMRVVGQSLT